MERQREGETEQRDSEIKDWEYTVVEDVNLKLR